MNKTDNPYRAALTEVFSDADGDIRWTPDGRLGLSCEDGRFRLLDEDGMPSNYALSPEQAEFIVALVASEEHDDLADELHFRWKQYASAGR